VCELRVRGTSGRSTFAPVGGPAQPNEADGVNDAARPAGVLDTAAWGGYAIVTICNVETKRAARTELIK